MSAASTRQAVADTVEHAAATPDHVQPFAELGLREEEYARVRDILGRGHTASALAQH